LPIARLESSQPDASARLWWSAPETRGAPITSYDVYYQQAGEEKLFQSTSLTQIELSGLEIGKIYDFSVVALSEAGPS
jgi:hypothetical protein